jgi:glycosyltransferase involved in cell wall biosynthesis
MNLFLAIAQRLPEIKFAIIGNVAPEKNSYYESLRKIAPGNVSFIISPLRKAKDILGRAKVYVHCAQGEHFGITIVEAMSAGCVPVVNNTGGPREIVSDDSGYKWNVTDQAVEQVSSLIRDDRLRSRLSQVATSRAKQFRPEVFESGLGKVLSAYQ